LLFSSMTTIVLFRNRFWMQVPLLIDIRSNSENVLRPRLRRVVVRVQQE
jgi:hypothetical protein